MNPTIIRTSIYAGLIGIILGTAFGVALSRLELRFLHPEQWYRDGGVPAGHNPTIRPDQVPSRHFLDQFDTTDLSVPEDTILRGGPPKDGIPAIDDPSLARADEVDFLDPDDRIIAVTMNGEARAYPVRLLNWHEIVNDELGGIPIAIIYCPLCDSFTVVDRRVNDETLTFGVSGLLYQSNVLMFDRENHGLWSQIMLEALSGPHAGTSLHHYGWTISAFEEWQREHPDGTVVTFETGHQRNYDANPYEEYFAGKHLMFPVKRIDDRMSRKERIIGVRAGDFVRAYPVSAVLEASDHRIIDTINGQRIAIEGNAETGRVSVVEMPDDVQVIHTFWFSWAAGHPETDIYGR